MKHEHSLEYEELLRREVRATGAHDRPRAFHLSADAPSAAGDGRAQNDPSRDGQPLSGAIPDPEADLDDAGAGDTSPDRTAIASEKGERR